MTVKQIDCFKTNIKVFKFLGIWPGGGVCPYYSYYSKAFVLIMVILYDLLLTINFIFLPRQLDSLVDEMIFYFTELSVTSKVLTFHFKREKMMKILETLESDVFQPDDEPGQKIVDKAKKFNSRCWKIVAAVSITSNLTHVLTPMIAHFLLPVKLKLPVCSYLFLPDSIRELLIYPLYFYQSFGMHFHMLCNVNVDTFFWGLLILSIAQLDILDKKLRTVTDDIHSDNAVVIGVSRKIPMDDNMYIEQLNEAIVHFDELGKFCQLIQNIFNITLFVQFGMASCIVCVCLFRFTLAAPLAYYVFLATYMIVMILQIMVPCWFGSLIVDKSYRLTIAVLNCDWTPRSRRFKSNLRIFVERANRPLSITGGKMFPLTLVTFTSIMNSAYSFFTLLRHMQSRQ